MASNASDAACPSSLGTLWAVHPQSHVCRTSLMGSAPEWAGTLFSSRLRLSFDFFFFFEPGSHAATLTDLKLMENGLLLPQRWDEKHTLPCWLSFCFFCLFFENAC